ncbi:MAG TPA: cytochrome c-type biogenesis CcmF C-terminal domain-containing protein [Ignavibacteria bacterium]|nr:cytochrome c-type biogenesis CcmF C-terminal domain-containing protein [Ignavibacteria bacterium]
MIGKILIYSAFIASIISIFSFFKVHFGYNKYLRAGRTFFLITVTCIIFASALLMYLILTHQYQYAYIWEHSNGELQLPLLISTFYAGQEGSFMLWTFMTAVIGIILLNYVSKGNRLEPQVMFMYGLVLAFLAFILILKSPFLYIWDKWPGEVDIGFMPEQGKGLNPLLQNFWMSIHPPTLFLGFASLAVPFSFAIATLMKNKYNEWINYSMPWLLFSGGILGLGIMMGGYWAYGVLGWGGYWAWDPVENSSFIPWLITVAAVHTMVAQKRTGGFKKTNLILCILAFLLVLYSTFLTRSGILGDSSVHSFVDPGFEVYITLLVFIGLFLIISVVAIIYRLKELKSLSLNQNKLLTRESALFVGAITLCAAATVIFAGTSWPIFSKGSVDGAFYNKMNLPLAIMIALINGISLLLKWKTSDDKNFFKGLIFPLSLSVVITVVLVFIGVQDFLIALFACSALFAFFINAQIIARIFKKNWSLAGAYIAHIGIALVFLGIIASARYSEEENISLELNKPKEAFGYTLTYIGASPFEDPDNKTDVKYHFNVLVEKDGKEMVLKPIMYFSQFSDGVMKNPDIANFYTKDLYLSPMGLEVPEQFSQEELHDIKKGGELKMGDLTINFIDFDFGNTQKGGKEMQEGNFTVGAMMKVSDSKYTENLSPKIVYKEGNPEYEPAIITGNDNYIFYFTKMNVPQGEEEASATIAVVDKRNVNNENQTADETLVVTASIKPFINVLWIGTVVLVLGFMVSIIRRRKELYSK